MEIESDFGFGNQLCSNQQNDIQIDTNDDSNMENEHQSTTEESTDCNLLLIKKSEKSDINFKFCYKRIIQDKKKYPIISSSEARLIKDIEEIKTNERIGKYYEVIVNDYKRIKDTENFEMIVQFKNYFSVSFIFLPDYPFSPPIISFYSGIKIPSIFDSEGKILLENSKLSKWTPALFLSHFIISIELLILNNINNNFISSKYGKRKWREYIKDEVNIFHTDLSSFCQLTKSKK